MQNTQSRASERVFPSFLNARFSGRVYRSDGETAIAYVVLKTRDVVAAYKEWSGDGCVCDDNREDFEHWLAAELGWYSRYGGPGRWYLADPVTQAFGKWLLVTQYGGLDV